MRFFVLFLLVLLGGMILSACSQSPQNYSKEIDNRHVFTQLLLETIEVDSASNQRYQERIRVNQTGGLGICSLLYQVNEADSITEVRVVYASSHLHSRDAIAHLKSTQDRAHQEGWHYQQWSFEAQ